MAGLEVFEKKKKFSFGMLNDGSCQKNLQVIMDLDIPGYEELSSLLAGASVKVKGKVGLTGGRGQKLKYMYLREKF